MHEMYIVYAVDSKYLIPFCVSITSLLHSLGEKSFIRLFIIDGGIGEGQRRLIESHLSRFEVALFWLDAPSPKLEKLKVDQHISLATYFRLAIPELLPLSVERVIYLDCDTVVPGDVTQLWKLGAPHKLMRAAQCSIIQTVGNHRGLRNYRQLNMSADTKYLQAGVLDMNLSRWRSMNASQEVIEYIVRNPEYVTWWDQDGINAVLSEEWEELDCTWNYLINPFEENVEAKTELVDIFYNGPEKLPNILHFLSSRKPWHADYPHPAKILYFHFLRFTPFDSGIPIQSHLRTSDLISSESPCSTSP